LTGPYRSHPIVSSKIFQLVFLHFVYNSALILSSRCCSFSSHVVANVIYYILSISSAGCTFSSSKISSFLVCSIRIYPAVILQNVISSAGSTFSSSKISSFLVCSIRIYPAVILQNVISIDVNRFLSFVRLSKLRGQANVITWIHKSIKNPIINYTYRNERMNEVRLNIGRGKIIVFLDSTPEKKEELKKRRTFMTNYKIC